MNRQLLCQRQVDHQKVVGRDWGQQKEQEANTCRKLCLTYEWKVPKWRTVTYKKARGRGGEEHRPLCDDCLWCLLLGEQNKKNTICTIFYKLKYYTANKNMILNMWRLWILTLEIKEEFSDSAPASGFSGWAGLWCQTWGTRRDGENLHDPDMTLKIRLAFSGGRRRTLLSGGSDPRLPGTPIGNRIRQIFLLAWQFAKQTSMCTHPLNYTYLTGVS